MNRLAAIISLGLAAFATMCRAQPVGPPTIISLDQMVFEAQNISMVHVKQASITGINEKEFTLTFELVKILKGKPLTSPISQLKEQLGELLSNPQAIVDRNVFILQGEKKLLICPGRVDITTSDFRRIRTESDLLASINQAVSEQSKDKPTKTVQLPLQLDRTAIEPQLGSGFWPSVKLPLNKTLTKRLLRTYTDPDFRLQIHRAWTFENNPESMAYIGELLKSDLTRQSKAPSENLGYLEESFYERAYAVETLNRFGVKVKVPPVTRITDKRSAITTITDSSGSVGKILSSPIDYPNLTRLTIADDSVSQTDPGEVFYDPRMKAKYLQTVTAADLEQLAQKIKEFPSLTYLTIAAQALDDRLLLEFVKNPYLKQLRIITGNLTTEGVVAANRTPRTLEFIPPSAFMLMTRAILDKNVPEIRAIGRTFPNLNDPFSGSGIQTSIPLPFLAAMTGNVEVLRAVLDAGLSPNALANNSESLLHYVLFGMIGNSDQVARANMIKLLLARGADIKSRQPYDPQRSLSGYEFSGEYLPLFLGVGADVTPISGTKRTRLSPEPDKDLVELYANPPKVEPSIKLESGSIVYSLDPNNLTQWSAEKVKHPPLPIHWSKTPSQSNYLGPFGPQKVNLSLAQYSNRYLQGKKIEVEFDLLVMGSWDGNGDGAGPDLFRVTTGGKTLVCTSFYNNVEGDQAELPLQSYPDNFPAHHLGTFGAREIRSLGVSQNGFPRDAVYRIKLAFLCQEEQPTITFWGDTKPQPGIGNLLDDEFWGIRNLTVRIE